MGEYMHLCGCRIFLTLAVAATFYLPCPAQEVASVDLSKVGARLDLRRPPATSPITRGYQGVEDTRTCSDSTRDVGALRTSLVSLDSSHYKVGDKPRFEVTVENAGSKPLRIPFSPHLADLQPDDPGQQFAYYELQIALWIEANGRWKTNTAGSAILYGANEHANTMLTLNPGELMRVVADGHFDLDEDLIKLTLSGYPADRAYAQASLFSEQILITASQSATVAREICMSKMQGQTIPIELSVH
jgi:hypothetical protein